MNHSGHATTLKLSFAPISNFDFAHLKAENIFQKLLENSMIYIIAQRGTLSFENLTRSEDQSMLFFDIAQKGNDYRVSCILPLHQQFIISNPEEEFELEFGSFNPEWKAVEFPLNEIDGIKIFDKDQNFKIWLSPGKLIHHVTNGHIKLDVNNDLRPFSEFKVHYVGKSTEQEIWKRLTGHSTLQEILSIEYPFNYGSLPTHEITLLLLGVTAALTVNTFSGEDEDLEKFVSLMLGGNQPTSKEMSLDAEKALINVFTPGYNKEMFKNYPQSKDGLYKYNFDNFTYRIAEDINLIYAEGFIHCSTDENDSDFIGINKNKEVELLRRNDS